MSYEDQKPNSYENKPSSELKPAAAQGPSANCNTTRRCCKKRSITCYTPHVSGLVSENTSMEMMKKEHDVSETRSTSSGIKSEPVVMPLQSYQHESLQCFKCLITFPDARSKQTHMRIDHWLEYTQQQRQQGERMSVSSGIKSEPVVMPLQSYHHKSLQCFQCLITFPDAKFKDRHMKKYHLQEYTQQLQQVESKQKQANIVFMCSKCSRTFSSSGELSQHQFIHIGQEKPYSCTFCPQAFLTFTEMNNHRRLECTGRQCRCKDCGAVFSGPSPLRTHRLQCPAEADDVTIYRCRKCRCGFLTKEKLLQHQEDFAGDPRCGAKKRGRKPKRTPQLEMTEIKKSRQGEGEDDGCENSDTTTEGCPQTELKIPCSKAGCDLIFPSVAALRAHKRGMHGPPPTKTHTCTECDESYAQLEQLEAHVAQAHSPRYDCPTLGKSFAPENSPKTL